MALYCIRLNKDLNPFLISFCGPYTPASSGKQDSGFALFITAQGYIGQNEASTAAMAHGTVINFDKMTLLNQWEHLSFMKSIEAFAYQISTIQTNWTIFCLFVACVISSNFQ